MVLFPTSIPKAIPSSAVTKNALWDNNTMCALFATGLRGAMENPKTFIDLYDAAYESSRSATGEDRLNGMESQTGYCLIKH